MPWHCFIPSYWALKAPYDFIILYDYFFTCLWSGSAHWNASSQEQGFACFVHWCIPRAQNGAWARQRTCSRNIGLLNKTKQKKWMNCSNDFKLQGEKCLKGETRVMFKCITEGVCRSHDINRGPWRVSLVGFDSLTSRLVGVGLHFCCRDAGPGFPGGSILHLASWAALSSMLATSLLNFR